MTTTSRSRREAAVGDGTADLSLPSLLPSLDTALPAAPSAVAPGLRAPSTTGRNRSRVAGPGMSRPMDLAGRPGRPIAFDGMGATATNSAARGCYHRGTSQ